MRMKIGSQSGLRGAWVFAPAIRQGPGVAWVALVFPVAGAGLLIWAVHLTLRAWRFGTSLFEMAGEAEWLGASIQRGLPGRLS
jgi:hypothetical protein